MINKKEFFRTPVFLILLILYTLVFVTSTSHAKQIAQEKTALSPYEKERTAEIESYLARAQNYFETVEFTFAQTFYDMALRLDKDNTVIKAKIEECKKYRTRQKELLETIPKGEKKPEYIDSKYKAAIDLYDNKNYAEAYKEFEEIWLVATNGEYKKTRKYMRLAKERMTAAEEKAAPKPTPAKVTPPEKSASETEKEKIKTTISNGEKLLKEKNYDAAIAKFQEVLTLDKNNKDAQKLLNKAGKEKDKAVARAESERKKQEEAKQKAEEKQEKEAGQRAKDEEKKKQDEQAKLKAQELEKQTKEVGQRAKDEEKKKQEAQAKLKAQELDKQKKDAEQRAKSEDEKRKAETERINKLEAEKLEKAKSITADARKLLEKGNYDGAISKAEEALNIEPLFAEAAQIKKTALDEKKAKEEESARQKEKGKEAKAQKDKINKLLDEGNSLYQGAQYDDATVKYQEILRLDPANAESKKMLDKIAQAKEAARKNNAITIAAEGKRLLEKNKLSEARVKFESALTMDVNNNDAKSGLQEIARREAEATRLAQEEAKTKSESEAQRLFNEGLKAYERKDIETAVARWQEALKVNPEHLKAKTYLDETRKEYDAFLKSKAEKESFDKKEADAQAKMKTLISVSTTVPHTPLISFLDSLSVISGINFYVTSGVEATVDVKFVDTPLNEVLDNLLPPIGLKWSRKPGSDVVTITPDLQTKIFSLTSEEAAKVKSLLESGDLKVLLWGKDGTPKMKGIDLTLDEREGILVSIDSSANIQKLDAFLKDLKTQEPPALEYRTYRLREGEGTKVKSLLEAILQAETRASYAPERKILLDDRDLIVKDTAQNIKRVEEILQDKGFIEKLRSDKLQIQTWTLVPKEALKQTPEYIRQFGEWVVQVVSVMLYSKSTRSKAEAEGRRLWYDSPSMLLTVVDYPDNVRAVSDFINSLPQLEQKAKYKIIPLNFASASDIVGDINSFLGITAGAEAGPTVTGGISITKTLSTGNDFTFRDITVRLMRVNENDANNRYDQSVELKVRTPGESRDVTLDLYDSETVGDYEIIIDDATASSTPGEGSARIKLNYIQPINQVVGPLYPTPAPTPQITELGEKPVKGTTDNHGIYVEYKDPTHLAKVEEWIKVLDVRKKQVSIEAKFVEVMESRAKQFSSQLGIADLTQGVDFDNSVLNMRFANDVDELQNALLSQYEPPTESNYFQHLLKGTTVLSLITGGNSPINWQLRLLEAEGVVNVISGPQIVASENETASFRITRELGGIPSVDASGNYVGGTGVQRYDPIYIEIQDLFVSPTGYIRFRIPNSTRIQDLDSLSGTGVIQAPGIIPGTNPPQYQPLNVQYTLSRLTKQIETSVQVKDGGTIVIGGWTNERSGNYRSGIPIIHNIPFIGNLLFGRNLRQIDKTTLLIFLTCRIVG